MIQRLLLLQDYEFISSKMNCQPKSKLLTLRKKMNSHMHIFSNIMSVSSKKVLYRKTHAVVCWTCSMVECKMHMEVPSETNFL
jgi:hypothetical protein